MLVNIHQCSPIYTKFPVLSWLIKFFQKTDYSHYAVQCKNYVLDATGKDVLPQSTHYFGTRYRVVKTFQIEVDADFEGFVNWSLVHIRKKYGFMQLVGLLLITIGLAKNNPWGSDSKTLVCNELVLYLMAEFKGFRPTDTDNYDLVQTEKVIRKYAVDTISYRT